MTKKFDSREEVRRRSTDGFGSPDVAQYLPEYDELEASQFASRLVRPVLDWPTRQGVVVGLFGPWGSGKTTILNYLDGALRRAEDISGKTPVIVPFNPWLYMSAEGLLEDFFRTLSSAYGETGGLSDGARKALIDGITKFGSTASELAPTPESKAVAFFVKVGLNAAANRLKKAFGGPTLLERRQAARELLLSVKTETPPRAVVLIDDLDRADPEEAKLVLRLVKLIADLPNVTYVIAADEERVRAITKDSFSQSSDEPFLDKIVQFKVYVPPILTEKMQELIAKSFNRVTEEAGVESDPDRLLLGRSPFFPTLSVASRVRTLRDRNRLENAFRLLLLTTDRSNPLNAADAFHLAFLQTFFPDVVTRVRREKVFLTGGEMRDVMYLSDVSRYEDTAVRSTYFDKLLTGIYERYPSDSDLLRELIRLMFPLAESGRGNHDVGRDRSANRIGLAERFDWYFQLSVPEQPISDAEAVAVTESLKRELDHAGRTGALEGVGAVLRRVSTDNPTLGADRLSKILDRSYGFSRVELYGFGRALLEGGPYALSSNVITSAVGELATRLKRSESDAHLLWAGESFPLPAADLLAREVRELEDFEGAILMASAYTRTRVEGIYLTDAEKTPIAKAGVERIRKFIALGGSVFDFTSDGGFPVVFGRWLWLLHAVGKDMSDVREHIAKRLSVDDGIAPQLLRFLATSDNEGNITVRETAADGTPFKTRVAEFVAPEALLEAALKFRARAEHDPESQAKLDRLNLVPAGIELLRKT